MNNAITLNNVAIISLKKVINERGHLMEVQRNDEQSYLGFGQAYVTSTLPGIVKAWYRHHRQIDQIALIKGEILLVLYDDRENSSTRGLIQEIVMSENNPLLVQIPVGIWHGFKSTGNEATYLLHLNDKPFSFEDPDEDRLPLNDSYISYKW